MVRHIALILPLPEVKKVVKVVEGTTRVVYVYDKVEKPVEEYGNVVVDYQDKQGNTIAERGRYTR